MNEQKLSMESKTGVINLVLKNVHITKHNRKINIRQGLCDILEESETSEKAPNKMRSSTPAIHRNIVKAKPFPLISKQTTPAPREKDNFIFDFVKTLSKHKQVYKSFLRQAMHKNLISNAIPKRTQKIRALHSKTPDPTALKRGIQRSKPKRATLLEASDYQPAQLTERTLNQFNELNSPELTKLNSKKGLLNIATSMMWAPGQCKELIRRENYKAQKIFMRICGGNNLLDSHQFKEFLELRYPEHMAAVFAKYLVLSSVTYNDYIQELEWFAKRSGNMHMELCFELFDFNKDNFICYEDTYSVMTTRRDCYADLDLFRINNMLELKLNQAQHDTQNVSLCLEEFCLIGFDYKPQVLKDFFQYTCNYDITKFIGNKKHSTDMSSEFGDTVVQYSKNESRGIKNEASFRYIFDLEEAKLQFEAKQATDLLTKFKLLRDDGNLVANRITKQSLITKFHTLFGESNEFIAERFFNFLSDNNQNTVSKSVFLTKIYEILHFNRKDKYKFAFDMYDTRQDGALTIDEIYFMSTVFPTGSMLYQECYILVRKCINSIFRTSEERLELNLEEFIAELNRCELTEEFILVFNTPYESLITRESTAFTSPEVLVLTPLEDLEVARVQRYYD